MVLALTGPSHPRKLAALAETNPEGTCMTAQYHKEGEWWVSPFNVKPEVTSTFNLPKKVEIHDATLRDGEQTPGVVFSPEDKIAMAEMMSDVGIDRIEAGMPAVSPDDYKAIKEICKLGLKSKIFTFARALPDLPLGDVWAVDASALFSRPALGVVRGAQVKIGRAHV